MMGVLSERGSHSHSFSRRTALQALAAAGALAGAVGCTDTSGVDSANGEPTVNVTFDIPAATTTLPTDKVQLRWMDSGDQKAYFFKPFFQAYQAKHSNISVDYSGSNWSQVQQVITLGIRNGTAPDVFQLPGSITIPVAVANKWIGALDDVVPNFDAIRKSYPPGVFVNGITDFGGKTYAVPLVGGQRFNNLMTFNKDIVARAEVDFDQVISWDDFRAALKKITTQGAGKYYGIVMGLAAANHLSNPVSTMAEMGGVPGGLGQGNNLGINWKTGEFNFTDPIAEQALELFLAINADGSFLPGSTSLDDAGARGRMPQGPAGVIFDGPWDIALWASQGTGFHEGLNIPPQRDPANIAPTTYAPGGNGKWVYKTSTTLGPVVGDIFSYLTSPAAQVLWTQLDRAADPPPRTESVKQARLNDIETKSLDIASKYMVLAPEPAARNLDVSQVYQQLVIPEPSFSSVCVGLLTGQIKQTPKQALAGLQSRYNKALDDTIAKVKKRGGKVSREDWVFSDWDPSKPYNSLYQ